MPCLFLTATGTDIGKTSLACLLIAAMRQRGQPVEAIKPVASGFDARRPAGSDAGRLLGALGDSLTAENIQRINPWRYAAALSPHLAAAQEGAALDYAALVNWCALCRDDARDRQSMLLIEGAGGVLSPLDDRHTMLDLMQALGVPVLLLADTALGSISYSLTAWRVLDAAAPGLRLCLVEAAEPAASLDQQRTILENLGVGKGAFLLPRAALDASAKAPHAVAARLATGQKMLKWLEESNADERRRTSADSPEA